MNRRLINYLTNIIGVAIISLAFYEYFGAKDWGWFIGLIIVGFSALIVENKTLQSILKTITGYKTVTLRSSIDSPDPNKEEK